VLWQTREPLLELTPESTGTTRMKGGLVAETEIKIQKTFTHKHEDMSTVIEIVAAI